MSVEPRPRRIWPRRWPRHAVRASAVLLPWLLCGCLGPEIETDEAIVTIQHHKTPCHVGIGVPEWGLLTTKGGQPAWTLPSIEGLDYVWGTTYYAKLEVSECTSCSDSGPTGELIELFDAVPQPAGTAFAFERLSSDYVADMGSGYALVWPDTGEVERWLECSVSSVCDDLARALDEEGLLTLELEHGDSPSDPLQLLAVE